MYIILNCLCSLKSSKNLGLTVFLCLVGIGVSVVYLIIFDRLMRKKKKKTRQYKDSVEEPTFIAIDDNIIMHPEHPIVEPTQITNKENKRTIEYTDVCNALKALYNDLGPNNLFSDSKYVVQCINESVDDSERISIIIRFAIDAGVGKFYLELINENKLPDDNFDNNVLEFLTDYGLSDDAAAMVINIFAGMLNWVDVVDDITMDDIGEISFGDFNGAKQWIVLQDNDDSLFILCKEAVCLRRFDDRSNDWEHSSLNKWLNGEFYNTAFSGDEKNRIIGELHLLSADEAESFFDSDDERKAMLFGTDKNCYWWLSTPGAEKDLVASVNCDGVISLHGSSIDNDNRGVRPAVWVKK